MFIKKRTLIKAYEGVQINRITDATDTNYIEKIYEHRPSSDQSRRDDASELEVMEEIIDPLQIPHARIIERSVTAQCTTLMMEFIDGIACHVEPKPAYLYLAAEKIGEVYRQSRMKMTRIDKRIIDKYSITKAAVLGEIDVIRQHYYLPPIEPIVDAIFERYQSRPPFISHGDLYLKNMIYTDDLHLIDWNSRISPFYTDLCTVIQQADEVGADIDEIKSRYYHATNINSIEDEELDIAEMIINLGEIATFIINRCPVDWIEGSYRGLMNLLQKFLR